MTDDEIVDCVVARGAPYAVGYLSQPKPIVPGTWVYMFGEAATAKRAAKRGDMGSEAWYQRIPWFVIKEVCDP